MGECKFRFMGETRIDFEVHETNKDGNVLDTKGVVSKRLKYSRECVVSFNDWSNLASADLVVEEPTQTVGPDCAISQGTVETKQVCFRDLPLKRDVHEEDALQICPLVLQATYGVACPYKVNELAPCGLSAYKDAISEGVRKIIVASDDTTPKHANPNFGGLFQCCTYAPIDNDGKRNVN